LRSLAGGRKTFVLVKADHHDQRKIFQPPGNDGHSDRHEGERRWANDRPKGKKQVTGSVDYF